MKMNWKWNIKGNLSRVTFQNNMQRKINANAFTRCDNKCYIKEVKKSAKFSCVYKYKFYPYPIKVKALIEKGVPF